MPEIKIENLNFSYGKKKKDFHLILNDINTVFLDNKINVILGPSGCGKTTLLKAILGLITFKGNVYFDGININALSIKERNVSYANQNITLFQHLSAFENIAFPLKVLHASSEEIRERVEEVAKMLHIEQCLSRRPNELSLGQCQRVLIAKALIKRPLVAVFDEPFSNLDEQVANEIILELKPLFQKFNTTVIFVSHDAKQAYKLADKMYVMNEGRIIDEGTPKEMLNTKVELTRELLSL